MNHKTKKTKRMRLLALLLVASLIINLTCITDYAKASGRKKAYSGDDYRIELTEAYKTGDVFSVHISGIYLDRYLYCYEADGKKIIDPYAKTITGCEVFGKDENRQHLSRVCLSKYDWEDDTAPEIPYHDSVFYKCSVRGLTASKTSKVRHKGTFSGVVEKLPYLKELGITAVLFMPLYEFDEIGKFPQLYDNGYGK